MRAGFGWARSGGRAWLRRIVVLVFLAGCGLAVNLAEPQPAYAFGFHGGFGGFHFGGGGDGYGMRRRGGGYGMRRGGGYGRFGMHRGGYDRFGGRFRRYGDRGRYGSDERAPPRPTPRPPYRPIGCRYRNCGGGDGGGYQRWPHHPIGYPWRHHPPPSEGSPPSYGSDEPRPVWHRPPRRIAKPVYTPPPPPPAPVKRLVRKPPPPPPPPPEPVKRLVKKPPPAPPAPPATPPVAATPPAGPDHFVVPPSTEARYVPNEVLVEIPPGLAPQALESLERRYGLTLIASKDFSLLDTKVNRYRIAKPRTVAATVQALRSDGQVSGAQPNYVFALQEDASAATDGALTPPPLPAALTPPPLPVRAGVDGVSPPAPPAVASPAPPSTLAAGSTAEPAPAQPVAIPAAAPAAVPAPTQPVPAADAPPSSSSLQYSIAAMHLLEAHRLATGKGVRVAIIDSGVDAESPEIAGRIVARYDTVGGKFQPHPHGTAIAGAILAHSKLLGVAPDAEVIAVRAFTGEGKTDGAEGTTYQILDGLEFAAAQQARIVNMSFAGAHDAMLARSLRKLRAKGVAEIAAAGNGGAKSDPLYPGAEPGVIAVTATDQGGHLFQMANRGSYIAVAAPGVDILLPAPGDTLQIASGTSIAAAEVTGIAALALQRYGILTPDALISALAAGARKPDPAASADEYGAGVIDALGVVEAKAGAAAAEPTPVAQR